MSAPEKIDQTLVKAIEQSVRVQVEAAAKKIYEAACADLQQQIEQQIDAMALLVLKYYSVHAHEGRIIITVLKPEDVEKLT